MDNSKTMCPVCTLYLREGVTLHAHLNTHPKDQVIEALLKVSGEAPKSTQLSTASASPSRPVQSFINSNASFISQGTSCNPQTQMTTAVTYQQFMTSNGSAIIPQYIQVPTIINPNTKPQEFVPNPPMNYPHTMYNPMYNPYIPHPYHPFTQPLYPSQPMSALPGAGMNTYVNRAVAGPNVFVRKCSVATNTESYKATKEKSKSKSKSSVVMKRQKQSESRVNSRKPSVKNSTTINKSEFSKTLSLEVLPPNKPENSCSSANLAMMLPPPLTPMTETTKRSLTGKTPPPPPLSKAPCFMSETLTWVKNSNAVARTKSAPSAITNVSSSDDINLEPVQNLNSVIVNSSTLIQNSNNEAECKDICDNNLEPEKTFENEEKNEEPVKESVENNELEKHRRNREKVFHIVEIDEESKLEIFELNGEANTDQRKNLAYGPEEIGEIDIEKEVEKIAAENHIDFSFYNKEAECVESQLREDNFSKPSELQPITYTDLQPAKSSSLMQELGLSNSINFNNFMEIDGIKIFLNNTEPAAPLDPLLKLTEIQPDSSSVTEFMKKENSVANCTPADSVIQLVSKNEVTFRDSYNPTTSHDLQLDLQNLSPMPLNIQADESMPARGELSEQESLGAENSTWNLFHRNTVGHVKSFEEWRNEPVSVIGSKKSEKSFKCSICNEIFSCPKERRVHKNIVHLNKKNLESAKKPKRYICNFCNNIFTSLKDRKVHIAEVHPTESKNKKSNQINLENGAVDSNNLNVTSVKNETEEKSVSKTGSPKEFNQVKYCTRCGLQFVGVKKLREHLRLIHGEIRFKCQTCSECFDEESEYNNHLLVHPLICEKCGKKFHKKPNLNLHMKRHLTVKPYTCSLCPKSFITRQKFEEHMNGHSGKKPLKCALCDKGFSRHSNLIQHKKIHHFNIKKNVKDFVCRCGEVFHSQKKLEWHKEVHDPRPKPCPFCSQKFIHSVSVTRHIRRAHLPEYLPGNNREFDNVQCPVCSKIYLRSSLGVHMRVHNGERPFACKVCNKRFATKWNLELHNWTHQSRNNLPFKCQICKSAFFRETDYITHLNAHRNYKPYTCNICGQRFIRKYNCLRHQAEHKKSKQFVCGVNGCGKSFHRGYYLRDHMRVHTGVRPHTCHICGKASSTKSNHNKHIRIHDTREPVNTEN